MHSLSDAVYSDLSFSFFGIFEIGSVLCGPASSSAMLIIPGAVAGLGAAGIINGAMIIVSNYAPLEKRPGRRPMWRLVNIDEVANYHYSR